MKKWNVKLATEADGAGNRPTDQPTDLSALLSPND